MVRKKEEWQLYEERLSHFFEASGINTAEKKQAVFLSVIGPAMYKILQNLISPAKPEEKSYAELTKVLSDNYRLTPLEIVEW